MTRSATRLALVALMAGVLTGCPMEDDLPPVPVISNSTDEKVTVVRVVPEEITHPGDPNRTIQGRLAPGEETGEASLELCVTDNGILIAVTEEGEEIDRWDPEDCPGGEVPDEWVITDNRSGGDAAPDP
jgi:hypothetical protein